MTLEFHKPVLLKEVINFLDIKEGRKYIDCTFGFGGHSVEILKRGGNVLGLDSDKESLSEAREKLLATSPWLLAEDSKKLIASGRKLEASLILENANFSKLEQVAKEHSFAQVSGIIYDLGLSSWQLEHSGRGFSFKKDEPLDMRADKSLNVTAANLVNTLSENELTRLFKDFGQEVRANRFARSVVRARSVKEISTTFDLLKALGTKERGRGKIHPATKVFQALRIAVNTELLSLENSLPQAQKLLVPGGRLLVISFHSLEDSLVKKFAQMNATLKLVTTSPVTASKEEVAMNPRSRSAKLRVYEKYN